MSVLDNYQCEGQLTLGEIYDLDSWFGKTSKERSLQTKGKTSERSSRKLQGSQTKMPLFLDLRTGSGVAQEPSWEMGGLLLGEYTMHSFGEYPNEENASRLSQILEDQPLPKYCLSAEASLGVLRRAKNRGKVLPEILEKTLMRQANLDPMRKLGGASVVSKNEQENQGEERESSSRMSESEHCQHSTINQYSSGEAIGCDIYNQEITGETAATLTGAVGGTITSGCKVMYSKQASKQASNTP